MLLGSSKSRGAPDAPCAWVTYRLSVTPIGGGVDPLARRSSRLDGQECQVSAREAECYITCSQSPPWWVTRPLAG